MNYRKKIVALFVFIFVTSMFILAALLEYNRAIESDKQKKNDELFLTKLNFENNITSRMASIDGLISYVQINKDFNQSEFEIFAKSIYESSGKVVKNITFLTDTTITHIYPYEGSAIGKDLALLEDQKELINYAKKNGKSVFVAPVDLVQGGTGAVVRIPIFIDSQYFGQAAAVFDYHKLMKESGIYDLAKKNHIELSTVNALSSKEVVIWENGLEQYNECIEQSINFYDTTLNIKLYPKQGWEGRTTLFYNILGIGLLVAIISYLAIYNMQSVREELEFNQTKLREMNSELKQRYDEIKRQDTTIRFLAERDPLTELYNRRKFTEILEENLATGRPGILIMMDIDNFKNINDTLGHLYGDKVLKHLASLIKKSISENASAFRLGGDEFIIIIGEEIDFSAVETRLKSLIRNIQLYNEVEQIINYITVSMGVVRYPFDGDNVETLMIKADISMYNAKKLGKNQYILFDTDMMSEFERKVKMENDLKYIIDAEEFTLLYQPIINAVTGEINYFEALIRIKDSDLPPDVFIPIAEETGYINTIGRWVIRECIRQLEIWKLNGFDLKPIAINLSPIQFRDKGLVEFIREELDSKGINSQFLEIEITENVLLENRDENIKILNEIKDIGVNIALDDFGTGYSSFSYLTYMPVSKIKLDKTLKDKFVHNEDNKVMDGLVSIAHGLKLEVVAEGIEEIEELAILKELNCDYLQGYLFSKPVEAQNIELIFNYNYKGLF